MRTLKPAILDIKLWLIASLTLGLAPFVPEPHLVGKIRWVAGGAVGMKPLDWLDLIWHGWPWIMLLISLYLNVKNKQSSTNHAR